MVANSNKTEIRARKAIEACVENGERLLDDAQMVEFQIPPATKLALSLIAQEEFAKSFLLLMVQEGNISWNKQILRAINDHACKQLLGVIIEYIYPNIQDAKDIEWYIDREFELGDHLPSNVADALNILRHEKIGRWFERKWFWADPPKYDMDILGIAGGKRDRIRQNAFYVGIGGNREIVSQPSQITAEQVEIEYQRASHYCWVVKALVEHKQENNQNFGKVRGALHRLFVQYPPKPD